MVLRHDGLKTAPDSCCTLYTLDICVIPIIWTLPDSYETTTVTYVDYYKYYYTTGQFGGYSRGLFQRNSEVMTVCTREPKKNEDNHNIALKLTLNHPNVLQYYGVTKINGMISI